MDFTLKKALATVISSPLSSKMACSNRSSNYWLAKAQDEFQFSSDGVVPVAKNNCGLTLYGFKNAARDKRLLIKSRFDSRSKDSTYFRLMLDIVTRYYFPHLQPTLCPMNIQDADKHQSYMEGFTVSTGRRLHFWPALKSAQALPIPLLCNHLMLLLTLERSLVLVRWQHQKLNYRGKTISVEADANCFTLLSQNVIANGSNVVVPVNAAIWNESGIKNESGVWGDTG